MEEKKFNGFKSEMQYIAVKLAVNDACGREDIDVKFDDDTKTIAVDGGDFSCTIVGDYLLSIYCDTDYDIDNIYNISDSKKEIWTAFEEHK